MTWETFRKRFIHPGWVDEHQRPKTMEALKYLAAKLPEDTLKGKRIAVWAHGLATAGYTFAGQDWTFICLYPHIESCSQSLILHTVAHEFAHAILGHPWTGRDNIEKEEREANQLAEELLR